MIALDIDGVLLNVEPAIEKHLLRIFGPAGRRLRNGRHAIQTEGGISKDGVHVAIGCALRDIDEIKPIYGAGVLLGVISLLTRAPVQCVTARRPEVAAYTDRALARWFGVPFNVVHTGGARKSEHTPAQFVVEDRRRNALELVDAGRTVLLLDTEYNQMPEMEGVIRFKNNYQLAGFICRHPEMLC
jgi:hypothetical protein